MNIPPNPPDKPSQKARLLIVDRALRQLRKTRSEMDPLLLEKVQAFVHKNPVLMKAFGLEGKSEIETKALKEQSMEKIDQGNNMEVVAKFIQQNPQSLSKIKSILLEIQKKK